MSGTHFPAIEVDIELGCVQLEQEVTESPTTSLPSPQSEEPQGRRTTGRLRLIILHLTSHRNVSVKSLAGVLRTSILTRQTIVNFSLGRI